MKLVTVKDGEAMTTSKIVADAFNKVHRDVMRKIASLDCSDEFRARNFTQSSYKSEQNKDLECFNITRDGFVFLCMGFTGKEAAKWKENYISAFNQMEAALLDTSPTLETVNEIIKRAESDKKIASDCASQLARYKKLKSINKESLDKAMAEVQLTLGFKVEGMR